MNIVQCVREIGPGGGVSGVAHALDAQFRMRRVTTSTFTIDNVLPAPLRRGTYKSRFLKKLRHSLDVLYFSIVGTVLGRLRVNSPHTICHNDVLFGKVYVNHGLHRAMLARSGAIWKYYLRNPLHAFLVAREYVRFTFLVHRWYVCFSSSEKEQLEAFYPRTRGRIRIIPNGVDVERFRASPISRQRIRSELGIAKGFVLIFIGHEFERKGLSYVLDALAQLPKDVSLIVLGGNTGEIGIYRTLAESLNVATRAYFLGVKANAEDYLSASDALVLPSNYESWALVGLEAMACGLPALLKPTGGISDYLKDGRNGYFIEQDGTHIASLVLRLMEDSDLLASMKDAAYRDAQEFAWGPIADKYIRLLQE